MLDRYSFEKINSRINAKHQQVNKTDKPYKTGIKYFSKLEQFLGVGELSESNKRLAYICKN
jgi:hypothetical protein